MNMEAPGVANLVVAGSKILARRAFLAQPADARNFRRRTRVRANPLSCPEIDPLFGAMVEAPGTGLAGRLPAPPRVERRVGGKAPGAFRDRNKLYTTTCIMIRVR